MPLVDNYNRANESPVSAPWVNSIYAADAVLDLVSNGLKRPSSGWGSAYKGDISFGPDFRHDATIQVAATGDGFELTGPISNGDTASPNGYFIHISGASGTWQLWKMTSGTQASIGATATGPSGGVVAGSEIRLEKVGTTIKAFYRAVAGTGAWTEIFSRTDSSHSITGPIGYLIQSSVWSVDSTSAETVTSGVTHEKTGALVADTTQVGADVAERAELGSLRAFSVQAGADASERAELGALISQAALAGGDVSERAELGVLLAGALLAGVSLKEAAPRPGSLIAGAVVSGVDVREAAEAGSLLAFARTAGVDVREAAESGLLSASALQAGSKVTERARAAYVAAQSLLAGADAGTMSEIGSLIAGAVLSGAGVKEGAGKSGTLAAGSTMSGVSVQEFGESGFLAADTLAAGIDSYTATKQGVLLAGGQLYGADVFTASRTGALVAVGSITALRQKEAERAGTLMARALLAGVWEMLTGEFLDGTEVHMLTSATVEGGRLTGASPEETVIVVTLPEKGQLTRVDI